VKFGTDRLKETFLPRAARTQDVRTGDTAAGTDRTWLVVHLATLVAGIPVLAWINRDQWFAGDEWQVITHNGLGSNPTRLGLFAPHFEHWSTLGVLVYKGLYGVFAVRSYWPYVAVLILVILAVAHMTWRLLLRVGVVPAYATAVAALTMIAAVAWENRSTAWQITIIAPVALGFGALLLMPERGPCQRRDLGVVALLLVGLMCSGVGVTMTAVVALAALLRRGWKVTIELVAAPAVVYGLWYVLEGTTGQRNDTSLATALRDLPEFVWRGLTAAFSDLTRVPDSGAVVLVLVAAWLVWRARPRVEPWPLVVATSVGAVVSIALTGLRRAGAGPESRYSDIVVLLALPALAVSSVIVLAFLVVQVVALNDEVYDEPFVGEMRPRVLATAQILRDHEPLASTNIFGISFLGEPSTTTIGRLDRNGELPALDVTKADVLTAREYIEAVVGDASKDPEGVATASSPDGTGLPQSPDGCVSARGGRVLVEMPVAGSIRVAADPTATAWLRFVDGDARGRPRQFDATPEGGTGSGVSRPTDVELQLPAGTTTTICGLAP
jgi:hypothetical protein